MKELSLDLVLYLLGGVGLLAIGIIPFRVVQMVRGGIILAKIRGPSRYLSLLIAVALLALLCLDAFVLARVAHCLTAVHCGPGVASGWLAVALLGATYVVMELVVVSVSLMWRRAAPR
jgi:hypothetical protein